MLKKLVSKNLLICVACLFFSTCFYYGCKNILRSYVVKNNSIDFINNKQIEDVKILKGNEIFTLINENINCLKKIKSNNLDDCIDYKNKTNETELSKENLNKAKEVGNVVGENIITGIEWILIFGLSLQVYLSIYTLFLEKSERFDFYIFHLSDWAINTPPILGVLANLLAFSLVLSKGTDKIMQLFNGYFFEATITTLIGGFFYIINLGLKIIIQSRLDRLKI